MTYPTDPQVMNVPDVVTRFRRPEYTGDNRCVPCTIVNACLAAVGAVVLAALTSPRFGAAALAVAGYTIYLRGYLIPGTPTLTKRYLPSRLPRLFGKESFVATDANGTGDGEVGETLGAAGVLTTTPDGPALSPAFRDAWQERTAATLAAGVDLSAVARAFSAEAASQLNETSYVLDGTRSVRWGSAAALAADVAAADLLGERVAAWSSFDHDRRRTTLQGLRLLLEQCPNCGATVATETDRIDPCCQKPHLVAKSVCEACGSALADEAVVDTGDVDSVPAALLDP